MTERDAISWPAIIVLYVATVLSMAQVGVVAALVPDLADAFGVSRQAVGLAISMFSAPSALFASVCGAVIDRFGPRTIILVAAALGAAANVVAIVLGSTAGLTLALLLAGVCFTGISVAAPAMIVTLSQGARQVRAMSLWSTYAPTGFAVGLLIGAPFAGTGAWVPAFAIQAGLMALAGLAALSLPAGAGGGGTGPSLRERLADFGAVFREIPVLRLAVAAAIPSALSYGVSLVSPAYLAEVHGVTMGASSTTVALAKAVAMVLCGLAVGHLLARKIDTFALFAVLAGAGVVAQFALFFPGSGFVPATLGLVVWLIAYGGMAAAGMALLRTVISDPRRSGAASGVVGQAISILSFLAPSIYFGMQGWVGFVALAGAGLLVTLVALPARGRRTAPA